MITYSQFIEELKLLVDEAYRLKDADELHHDPKFRRWRHCLTDLLRQIEDKGYSVGSSISTRQFDIPSPSYGRPPSKEKRIEIFNRELTDTINELETLITNYEKFGEPSRRKGEEETPASPLEWPKKITLAWLFHNAPISLWSWFISILLAAFIVGTQVGQSKLYQDFVGIFSAGNQESKDIQEAPNAGFKSNAILWKSLSVITLYQENARNMSVQYGYRIYRFYG